MRKLLWAAGVLLLIAMVLLVAAALSLNRIIAHQQDRLLQQARAALGRDLAVDAVSISLWSGLGVRADNLRVGEDPQFASTDFLRAANVIVRPKLLPLLHGRLEVHRIDLRQPEVQLIRNRSGQWNYATLGHHPPSTTAPSEPTSAPAPSVPPEQLPLVIGQANIQNGTFTVIDRSRQPEQTLHLTQVDLSVGDISADTPLHFDLDAAMEAERQNIHLRGVAGPWRQGAAMRLQLDGDVGPLGPEAMRASDVRLEAALTPTTVQIAQLRGRALDGSFQLTGQYPLHADGDEARLQGELSHIAIGQLLRLTMRESPQRVQGSAHLKLDLHARGTSADALRSSLTGQIAADTQDVVLKNFNLVNEILGQLTDLPRVGELVSRKVKPKYSRLFSQPDTHFRRLHTTLTVADQRMRTDDLTVEGDDFGVRGAGWVGFNRDMDLTGTLEMSKPFTRDVIADVREARYLIDEHEQLSIPFRLRGQIGQARPQPDIGYLVARLSQAIAPGAVKDLVEKFLGTKPRRATPGPQEQKSGNPFEERLRDLLGR